MKQIILGTAGHIDHGKTSLVKLLTGIDADRLKEEKERGITIELGFAWLDLPDQAHIGIIDVPGHEKFVRTMVAGAGGIDFVCLVIAADEGVMPQTREHFDICRLLGIRQGLIALTKIDLVDEEWREMVIDDVARYVEGTFLEDAPIVPVSAATGEGKDALIEAIAQVAQKVDARASTDLFRLPIDRVFTMKGFGTVITGTCVGGRVAVGDTVEILPSGRQAKVRGLQVHNAPAEESGAGLRTAVNFQGLDKDQVDRGETLIKPGTLSTTYLLDARIDLLASAAKPLIPRTRIRFHHLTTEILGRVVPLSDEAIKPGQSGIIQLRLEAPALVVSGDRFVLRSYSPLATIGGGVVLHPRPKKHKQPYDSALKDLETLETGAIDERISLLYQGAGKEGLRFSVIPALLGETEKKLLPVYRDLLGKGALVRFDADDEVAVARETFDALSAEILAFLSDYHQARPTLEGVSAKELSAKVDYGISPKLANRLLARLEKDNQVKRKGDIVSLIGHQASLKGGLEELGLRLLAAVMDGGLMPPTFKELAEQAGGDAKKTRQVLDLLVNENRIVRISESLYYGAEALENLKAAVQSHLDAHGELDAQAFKTLSGASRKYSIPLLEYFDAIKLTLRVGDKRVSRKS